MQQSEGETEQLKYASRNLYATPSVRGQFAIFDPNGTAGTPEWLARQDGGESPQHTATIDTGVARYEADVVKYVDDTTLAEILDLNGATRHVSTARAKMTMEALSTSQLMSWIINRANSIGMKVNNNKTNVLCIGPPNGHNITATVSLNNNVVISSGNSLRLLGFYFNSEPNANCHVQEIKKKFRARYWSLVHLRRANIKGQHLFRLYTVFIRPVIEFCAIVYHSMLTKQQEEELEALQRKVIRLCYGYNCNVDSVVSNTGIESLKERHLKSIDKFIVKNYLNDRFSHKWFPRRHAGREDIRRMKHFIEPRTKTNRLYNSPLNYMRRRINYLKDNNLLAQPREILGN